ncbi:MAG: hypothetical protein Q8P12_01520 [bacterium]|nr:hypothetical protein [bacterium]
MESLRQDSPIELSGDRDFELLSDLVLLVLEEERLSEILYVPVQDESRIGRVVKVGQNPQLRHRVSDFNIGVDTGVPIEHVVQPGDRVIFSKHQGMNMKWEGQAALMLHEDEIYGVLEPDEPEPAMEGDR